MDDLRLLVQSRYPILYVETYDEERMAGLLARVARQLGLPFFSWSVTRGLQGEGPAAPLAATAPVRRPEELLATVRTRGGPALYLLRDFHPYLGDPAIVRALRELAQEADGQLLTLVLCSPALELPIELRKVAARYRLELPGEEELRQSIVDTFREMRRSRPLRYGLNEGELRELAQSLRGLTLSEVRRLVARCTLDDGALDAADLPRALAAKREEIEQGGILELWPLDGDEAGPLGGLGRLKDWLRRSRAGFSERARELGLPPPRGVLLVGVQGCGKSLAAKAIAREWGLPLARLDPGRLLDKYVGESEHNLRIALSSAAAMAPLVLWIDEIEKVFPATGPAEADAGLGRRLFGGLLTWLQERRDAVFVAATANDLHALPPELLRKGRFDEVFFVDLPGAAERAEIFAIHLRRRRQEPERFDLEALARQAQGLSGAEIEQTVVAALYGLLAEGGDRLTMERLEDEIDEAVPLSRSHREQVEALRAFCRERFAPAG